MLARGCGVFAADSDLPVRGGDIVDPPRRPVLKISVEAVESTGAGPDVTVNGDDGEAFRLSSSDFDCRVVLKKKKGELKIRPDANAFNTFLRVLYSVVLLGENGFLVHAAGLERNGEGYLFPGRSSSGKTTLARNAKGFRVLSDELVAVRRENKSLRLFSTPFSGEYDGEIERLDADLKAMVFLNARLEPGKVTPVKEGHFELAVNLMRNVFFFLRDGESSRKMLHLCCAVCDNVPGYNAGYVNTASLGEIVGYI